MKAKPVSVKMRPEKLFSWTYAPISTAIREKCAWRHGKKTTLTATVGVHVHKIITDNKFVKIKGSWLSVHDHKSGKIFESMPRWIALLPWSWLAKWGALLSLSNWCFWKRHEFYLYQNTQKDEILDSDAALQNKTRSKRFTSILPIAKWTQSDCWLYGRFIVFLWPWQHLSRKWNASSIPTMIHE